MDPKRFIANHVVDLPKSGIRDFFEIVAKMKNVISLGIGEPDFDTPWHIREAAIYALEKGKTHYTSNLGLIELRRAISKYVARNFEVTYRPEDEVIVTVGVSEALDLCFRALCNPGDKVMFHQPCYVSYAPSVTLVHGVGVPVPTYAKDNFALTAEALRAAWQPGCKMLVLNLPCNPTGGGGSQSIVGWRLSWPKHCVPTRTHLRVVGALRCRLTQGALVQAEAPAMKQAGLKP